AVMLSRDIGVVVMAVVAGGMSFTRPATQVSTSASMPPAVPLYVPMVSAGNAVPLGGGGTALVFRASGLPGTAAPERHISQTPPPGPRALRFSSAEGFDARQLGSTLECVCEVIGGRPTWRAPGSCRVGRAAEPCERVGRRKASLYESEGRLFESAWAQLRSLPGPSRCERRAAAIRRDLCTDCIRATGARQQRRCVSRRSRETGAEPRTGTSEGAPR